MLKILRRGTLPSMESLSCMKMVISSGQLILYVTPYIYYFIDDSSGLLCAGKSQTSHGLLRH
ncbi:hypothetical protein J41TS12_19180 [Paenibacillus antibioticophila]|uniref:Uncharacterized protein n=1 Tax=Paenibacillus antibioticophila TaxID=1274374 RepID=A0A919XUU0_9BACL|nr:hypothetical protein J41TS12_19180 [Paenibacillus antibioticophila]